MDPATIIGTTSAILSFVLFTGKIISTAVQVYKNASGASEDNQKFADVVANFDDRLKELRKNASVCKTTTSIDHTAHTQPLNDAEKQLLVTINKCEVLAGKINDVLEKTKAVNKEVEKPSANSWAGRASLRKRFRPANTQNTSSNGSGKTSPTLFETMRAAVQTVWHEDAVKQLRSDWESCSIQLDQVIFRFETGNRLEVLHGVLKHHSADLADIRGLVHSLIEASHKVAHLDLFLQEMQDADSHSSRQRRNHEKILDALQFPGMHARRDRVAEAAQNTFSWLIEDESTQKRLSPGLEISLRQWLRTGTCVFHVTGKPGSGKSTFMKFIDKSKEADVQLRKRADEDQKCLIRASCYLWKAAEVNSLQNELEGLTRTLLFQILQGKPDLTRTIFENHPSWDPKSFTLVNCLTNSHSTAVNFESQEILAALESALAISDYNFFLLIDGLDEMKTTGDHDHREIAEKILNWSTHNAGRVEICVSSREDAAFLETFPVRHRLQLHAVTPGDIKALVDLKLKEHEYLSSEERESLGWMIASQAQGVFLWVVLALRNLRPLFNSKQGIQRLASQVRALPEEMGEFLAETLKRIPECYRKEAWALFTVLALDSVWYTRSEYALFHFSMLEKCLDGNGWRLDERKDFMSAQDVAHQMQDFASRIPDLSSGLLELENLSGLNDDAWRTWPCFTHRSVTDFLQEHPDKLSKALAIPRELQRLSAPELIIRSIIQAVTRLPLWDWSEPSEDRPRSYGTSISDLITRQFMTLAEGEDNSNLVFPLLKILEEVLLRKQRIILDHKSLDETQWQDLHLVPHAISVFYMALESGYRPYVDWAQEKGNYPSWIVRNQFKAWTVERSFHSLCVSHGMQMCRSRYFAHVLSRSFRSSGLSFRELGWLSFTEPIEADRSLILGFSPVLRGAFWMHLLIFRMVFQQSSTLLFETLLQHSIDMIKGSASVILDTQFAWWSDHLFPAPSSSASHISSGDILTDIQRSDWLGLEDKCQDEPRYEMKDEPGDEPKSKLRCFDMDHLDNESERHSNGTESESDDSFDCFSPDDPQFESVTLRDWLRKGKSRGAFPPGSRFGLTVRFGGEEKPQLIQGPQWINTWDNELLPIFVGLFQKSSGTASFQDILGLTVSWVLKEQQLKRLFEKWASEVREGRRDLEIAHKDLMEEIRRSEEDYSEFNKVRMMGTLFRELFTIISILEESPNAVLQKDSSEGTRHKGYEGVENSDSHERRVLGDSAVEVLKDKTPILSKIRLEWSAIILLCLGDSPSLKWSN